MTSKTTPLYEVHERLGAKFVEFHGWAMPVQYSGVIGEHECVREKAGLFDVSHMGEFLIFGPKAEEFVNHMVTNDVSALDEDQCMYTPMCYENGTIVDDLLVYVHNKEHYMLVVNAGNIEKDCSWIEKNLKDMGYDTDDVSLRDVSETTAMIALQGPKAEDIIRGVTDPDVTYLSRFRFREDVMFSDVKAVVSRTGYTGEDGFEIYVKSDDAEETWDILMEAGEKQGLHPIGLGARDTLRLEAGLMLYGNDIDETTTPLEATIGWTVKFDKRDFIGRDELLRQHADGLEKKLVGFEVEGKAVAREGYKVYNADGESGHVTSGSYSPTLKRNIGLAYVKAEDSELGSGIEVEVREKRYKAKVVNLPFIKR
ncbi:MAG: glycine cleavage system aminomethyltransferase GcvT [Candidatus Altiarchaeales archaeon]|nr:glycine cleavage system aminomethyltransferase GcvT [Candidatus Altiarchaeales archaeon]MBD3416015.1 glycine cleavage system aminomethyltransferase GcvT [Candidatus Altiarchaeales archaeon]